MINADLYYRKKQILKSDDTRTDNRAINRLISKLNLLLKKNGVDRIEKPDFEIPDDDHEDIDHPCDFGPSDIIDNIEDLVNENNIILKYEDANFVPLDNCLPFDVDSYMAFIPENIALFNAKYIGVYKNEERIGTINLDELSISDSPQRKYRVGLLSDIHFNDYDCLGDYVSIDDSNKSEYYPDTQDILKYFSGKTGELSKIDFIAAAGDVSTDNINNVRNFYLMLKNFAGNIPFFSSYGNHDHAAARGSDDLLGDDGFDLLESDKRITRTEHWNHLMFDEEFNKHLDGKILNIDHYINDPKDTGYATFSFDVPLPGTNKTDQYIFLSVNYNNNGNTANQKIRYIDLNSETHFEKIPVTKLHRDTSKSGYNSTQGYLYDKDDYNIGVKFTSRSQRFWIYYKEIPNATNTIRINKAYIEDAYGNDITEELLFKENPMVGIYGADGIYHLQGEIEANIYGNYLELPLSSSFYSHELPLNVYLDIEILCKNDAAANQNEINRMYEYVYEKLYPGKTPLERTSDEAYYDFQFYDPGALLWLIDKFEKSNGKRIFLFTHQFFPHKAGNNNRSLYYSYAGESWRISSSQAYCVSGIQFELLDYLNNTYNNSIWFTGHSHYKWEWQQYDPAINVTNIEYDYIKPGSPMWREDHSTRYKVILEDDPENNVGEWWELYNDYYTFGEMSALSCMMQVNEGEKYTVSFNAATCYAHYSVLKDPQEFNEGDLVAEFQVIDSNEILLASVQIPLEVGTIAGKVKNYTLEFVPSSMMVKFRLIATRKTANWMVMRINKIKHNDIIEIPQLTDYVNESPSPRPNDKLSHVTGMQLPQEMSGKPRVIAENTAYNVHLPSSSRPIPLKQTGYGVAGADSQGAIMDVYENYIDIRGIVFKDSAIKNLGDEYVWKEITSDMCYPEKSNPYYDTANKVYEDDEYHTVFVFSQPGQTMYIDLSAFNNESMTIDWAKNQYLKYSLSDIEVYDANGVRITDVIYSDNGLLGFDSNRYSDVLSISNSTISKFYGNKIAFKCSASTSSFSFPIYVKMNMTIEGAVKINYINKYIPIGQYRIPVKAK